MSDRTQHFATCLVARRVVLAAAASLLAASAARADSDPSAPVAELNQGLLGIMRAGQGTPFPQRYTQLLPIVERVFDLPAVLRASVGPRWSSLPAPEQARLLAAFTRFTVASYVANFDSFSGQKFEVLPDQRSVGADRVVSTRIIPASGSPRRIDYQMRDVGGAWRAVDVLLDGSISRVAVQRSDFRSLLVGDGAEALIESLNRKVADLSGGSLPA